MKQVLQDLSNGETKLVELPCPQIVQGQVLISTRKSLVSVGTERMLVEFGKSNLIEKALSQPDKVKMVFSKVKTDGLLPTLEAVGAKLNAPLPLGYCNVGIVEHSGGTSYEVGTRVVSNGPHAEIVRVPKNLCAPVPDDVCDESAAFTVLASIAMQGVRIANPTIGELVVVTGLGLIGLITVQILKANGCRVLGIDFDTSKCSLARDFGADTVDLSLEEEPVARAYALSRGRGVDAVIITASTKSNEPVSQAAVMCRKRGRVVLVGVVGLKLSRADFYEKEISFQVSCSYGPGRYDSEYEEQGNDYPVGFVRWTEQRNFEAVLDLMSSGAIDVKPLISHRFDFDSAVDAYKCLDNISALGILLNFKNYSKELLANKAVNINPAIVFKPQKAVCGFVGSGNYASRVLIPAFKTAGAQLHSISTSGGVNGVIHGRKAGFLVATTDNDELINSVEINTIVIVTRHGSHSQLVKSALDAQKHVFVEKPLALDTEQLAKVVHAYKSNDGRSLLMVGFNRRFSPQVQKMKVLLESVKEPKSFIMTMNAGAIPADHWTQDNEVGGGRIIGEACHFIDLMRFLAGSEIVSVQARRMGDAPGVAITEDKASITLGFADGSFGTILYFSNGSSSFPKERVEVFAAGRTLQLDNFRKLKGYGWPGFRKMNLWRQDKGQNACCSAFLKAIEKGLESPISPDEIFEVARVSVQVADILRAQQV